VGTDLEPCTVHHTPAVDNCHPTGSQIQASRIPTVALKKKARC
jgi:hypothetical protein